jgi:hypothetical protein
VRIAEFERLAQIVPERLAQIPGVARTEAMVAFCYYSNYDLDRIWLQGLE